MSNTKVVIHFRGSGLCCFKWVVTRKHYNGQKENCRGTWPQMKGAGDSSNQKTISLLETILLCFSGAIFGQNKLVSISVNNESSHS